MTTLHLIDKLNPGGAQSLLNLILHHNSSHHALTLKYSTPSIPLPPHTTIAPTTSALSLTPIIAAHRHIRHLKPSTLHCHLPQSQITGFLLKLLHPHLKLVFHHHGTLLTSRLHRFIIRIIYPQVDLFLAASPTLQSQLTAFNIPPSKIAILPNCVDTKSFNPKIISPSTLSHLRRQLQLPTQSAILLFVGRLHPTKGLHLLLSSLPYLDFPFTLLILGNGPQKPSLLHLASQLSLTPHLRFLGYQPDPRPFYALANATIIPSLSEGFSLTLLESWAMHTPVIASNRPALDQLITHHQNGLLVDPTQPTDLASKITLLKTNPTLSHQLTTDATQALTQYTKPSYSSRLTNIYKNHGLL